MKKVGILTFQYADNYGAVLQCYALKKVIDSLDDCCAEIINFRPAFFTYAKYWNNQREKRMFERKRELFEQFLEIQCGVNLRTIEHIDGTEYDYYCVGSDQVWNTTECIRDFFLPDVPDEIPKIAYAPSIGLNTGSLSLDRNVFRKYLPRFKAISVREQEHVQLLEELANKECKCVLDPTLLLEAEDYESLIRSGKIITDPFIFFFWLKHDDNLMRGAEFANSLAHKFDMPIIHSITDQTGFMFYKNSGCMMFEGIENFLWYIKNASFVVTNSYHATLFSIQFRRPFYTFVVDSMSSRINTLISKIGIKDRVIRSYLPISKVQRDMDFDFILKRISEEKMSSIQYLKQALDVI